MKSSSKRVSTSDKLDKIINFFITTSEVYTIKDLDKKLPKKCGISSMQIKDLLQKLLIDNLINQEKVGTTNLYWKFKYSDIHKLNCEKEKVKTSLETYESEISRMRKKVIKLEESREVTDVRKDLLSRYKEVKEKIRKIDIYEENLKKFPREIYDQMKEEIDKRGNIINQITDDIFTLQSYVCNKFGMTRNDFNNNFNIDEEMDYI